MVVTCEDMKTTAIQSQLVKIGIRHQKMKNLCIQFVNLKNF